MSYPSFSLPMKAFQLTTLSLALALAGCGGDGTDTVAPVPDTGVTQPSGPNIDNSITQASGIYISSDKEQLLTGQDQTALDIRVTDGDGGIVSNAPVNINISNAGLFGLSLSTTATQITDDQGLITVDLIQSTTGIDSQLNHESVLTVSANTINGVVQQTLPIMVSGTEAINVVSTNNTVNTEENFRISGQIVDGASRPVANADVILYSNDDEVGSGKLDSSGNFIFDLNASNLEAINDNFLFSIEIKGAQISQRIPDILTVVSTNSSSISFSQTPDIIIGNKQKITLNTPNASNGDLVYISTNKGEILANVNDNQGSSRRGLRVANNKIEFYIDSSVPGRATLRAEYGSEVRETILSFVSISPTKLLLQTERSVISTGGSTPVIARVLDKDDAPVKNAIVQFTTIRDASGGNLNQGVAYTDDNGIAKVMYSAGLNSTSTNGVVIRAQVQSVKLPNGQEKIINSPKISETNLTVQTKSTYISFAFADKVSSDDSQIYYFRNGSASVLDNAGQPAINQPVSIIITPDSYLKGFIEVIDNVVSNGGAEGEDSTSTEKVWSQEAVTCENEDKNNNGILDVGEDFNNNGRLDPINVAVVLTDNGEEVDSGRNYNFVTDDTGRIDFLIRYPKQYANWYRAKVTVNTRVDGSESQQSRIIDFPALVDDVDISVPLRPNTNSPFGTQLNCSSPN